MKRREIVVHNAHRGSVGEDVASAAAKQATSRRQSSVRGGRKGSVASRQPLWPTAAALELIRTE
jgi:hypothetical protein